MDLNNMSMEDVITTVAGMNSQYFELAKDFSEVVVKLYLKQAGFLKGTVPEFNSEEIFKDLECLKTFENLKHDIYDDGYDEGFDDGFMEAEDKIGMCAD